MVVNKHYIWILLLFSLLFNTAYAQTITFEVEGYASGDPICSGTAVTIKAVLLPEDKDFDYEWIIKNTSDYPYQVIKRGIGDDFTFHYFDLEYLLSETAIIEVRGQSASTNFISEEFTINVVSPNPAGDLGKLSLCGAADLENFNLYDSLEGEKTPGGTWTFKGNPHSGIFTYKDDGSGDVAGDYVYKVASVSPCTAPVATVRVRECFLDDYDRDGVPNDKDEDDDNDGILDIYEDNTCSTSEKKLVLPLVDYDFGEGGPTTDSNVLGHDYTPNLPLDGLYNVATSEYMYNVDFVANFVATDTGTPVHGDGSGNTDGRFLCINVKAGYIDNVYQITDIPIADGSTYNFNIDMVGLCDTCDSSQAPILELELIDQADGTPIASYDSTTLGVQNNDQWVNLNFNYLAVSSTFLTLNIKNLQPNGASGNDIGIDNVLFAPLSCDFDNDEVPNSADVDSDNDGVFDAVEAGFNKDDIDANGQLIGDVGPTGIPLIAGSGLTSIDVTNNGIVLDYDNDGSPNFLDHNSDEHEEVPGGNCSDANEAYGEFDADGGDGQYYGVDPQPWEIIVFTPDDYPGRKSFGAVIAASYVYPVNTDSALGDTELDFLQEGPFTIDVAKIIPDGCMEKGDDHDEDGIPDGIAGADDLDDDNDGILDTDENGGVDPFADADSDGVLDYMDTDVAGFTDVNNDGIDDAFDFDLDGIINQFDVDSDNDGIYDHVEAGSPLIIITDDYGQIGLDADVEVTVITRLGLLDDAPLTPADFDADGLPNFLDIDADGDGILDNYEFQPTNGYAAPSGIDADENGADDIYEGLSAIEPVSSGIGSPDYLNINSDDSCLSDTIEAFDFNKNGLEDDITPGIDSNNDGLADGYEAVSLTLIAAFPNIHNPITVEVDYREEFDPIVEDVDADAVCNNDTAVSINLFDELELDADIKDLDRVIGTWSVTTGTATVATDGSIEPSNLNAGDYVFEYVISYASTCEHTYTLNIEILEEPYVGDVATIVGPVVCDTELIEEVFPFASIEAAATDIVSINGLWTVSVGDASAVTLPATAADYNKAIQIDTSLLAVDDEITLTYLASNVSDATCSASIDVVVKVSSGRNAGVTPVDPVAFCVSDTTISDPLITHLGDAEEDGVWSSVDDSVSDFTALGNAFAITPSTLLPGTYTYVYFLGRTTCDEATSSVTVVVNPSLNAGLDEDLSATPICKGGGDFSIVSLLSGTRDLGGVWTSQSGNVVFDSADDQGLIDVSDPNLLEDDVYIYTVSSTLDGACADAVAEITLKIVDSPSPGTLDTSINANFCESDNATGNLFDYILDEDAGGLWTDQTTTVITDGLFDLTGLTPGDYTYTYTVNGLSVDCPEDSIDVVLKINPELVALMTQTDDILCREVNGSVDLSTYLDISSTTGGTWSGGVVTAAGILDFNTAADEERYIYTVEPAVVGGCTSVSAFVDIKFTEDRDAGADPTEPVVVSTLSSAIDLFSALNTTETDGSWTGATGNGHLGTLIPSAIAPGDYTFTYTLPAPTGSSCDPDDATVILKVLAPPVFNFDPPVCKADRLTYDVTYAVNDAADWDINFVVVSGSNLGNITVDTISSTILNIPSDTEIQLIVTDKLTGGIAVNQNFSVPSSDCPCDVIAAPTNPSDITICEEENNPPLSVDLPAGQIANWYINKDDSLDNATPIHSSILPYTRPTGDAGGHFYYVRAYDPVSRCESTGLATVVKFTIYGILPVDLEPQEFLCVDVNGIVIQNPPLIIESEPRAGFTYQWHDSNGEISGETDPTLEVDSPGTYYVVYESSVANTETGEVCSVTSSNIVVTPVVEPILLPLTLGSVGFSKFNSITATLENGGDPNSEYEYDLDGEVFQESNVFENVATGFHTVTVTDLKNCGSDSQGIYVIGFPKFFTPNGAGPVKTETWNVDLDPNNPIDMNIFIYDRFGKLIQQVFPDKTGWDGTFAGKNMPSDDYWFIATMKDTGETYASHFTLVR